jgi:hypothetical protein
MEATVEGPYFMFVLLELEQVPARDEQVTAGAATNAP